jgi:hypothetical protein
MLRAGVSSGSPAAPQLSVIRTNQEFPAKPQLQSQVESHIRSRISEMLSVEDLARHAGLGLSTFAHTYRKLVGETPYQTIVRIENAGGETPSAAGKPLCERNCCPTRLLLGVSILPMLHAHGRTLTERTCASHDGKGRIPITRVAPQSLVVIGFFCTIQPPYG